MRGPANPFNAISQWTAKGVIVGDTPTALHVGLGKDAYPGKFSRRAGTVPGRQYVRGRNHHAATTISRRTVNIHNDQHHAWMTVAVQLAVRDGESRVGEKL